MCSASKWTGRPLHAFSFTVTSMEMALNELRGRSIECHVCATFRGPATKSPEVRPMETIIAKLMWLITGSGWVWTALAVIGGAAIALRVLGW